MGLVTRKLGSKGFGHILVPLIVVVGIGVFGSLYFVFSEAATPAGSVEISNKVSGYCLDDFRDSAADRTKADVWTCNKTKAQSWTLASATNTTAGGTITNANGACLDVYRAGTKSGTVVELYSCNKTVAQDWYLKGSTIVNPHSSLCLTDTNSSTTKGTQLTITTCSGASSQVWTPASLSSTGSGSSGGSSGTTGSGSSSTSGGTTTSSAYTVEGNKIVNSAGQDVYLHGVDRPSLEWSCSGSSVTGQGTGIPASDFTTMHKDWNADSVRIAVSEDRWLSGTASTCSTYQSNVETAVKNALAAGMIAIIDLHWSDQGNGANATGQQCMPDQNSVTFWQQVATMYKSNPNVWFELYNEPYPPGSSQTAEWNTLENGGSVTCNSLTGNHSATWNAPGMQTLVNTVRATGAKNIVIAGGLSFSSVLAGEPTLTGGNVAYSVHPYENTSDPDGSTDGSWANNFGNRAAVVPVIATEFGDKSCGAPTYDNAILSYFKAHDMGFTAWAWYVGGCSFPSLITNAAGTCVDSMGCTIQKDMESYPVSP
jgi:endoglucanase